MTAFALQVQSTIVISILNHLICFNDFEPQGEGFGVEDSSVLSQKKNPLIQEQNEPSLKLDLRS
jgi:hypothetical protein